MRITTIALTLVLAATACAKANPVGGGSATPGPIGYATGADDLILRVATQGGFVAPAATLGQVPTFSLYGDGTAIFPGVEPTIFPGPALPALQRRRIDPNGVQAILAAAMRAGLGSAADMTSPGSVGISDMPTTVFTLDAGGLRRTVNVYALGAVSRETLMPAAEYRARRSLERFVGQLARLQNWLPQASMGPASAYAAGAARIYAATYRPQQGLRERPAQWPLPTPLPAGGSAFDGYRCVVVGDGDWTSSLRPLAEGANQLTPWIGDGARFALVFRPLLPDEHGC